ncbi:hypothetical protein HGRIS_000551 [Hohenbuehelia grisea]|uniref:Uncharacterized protein n=1 Tax=Hohenbuehelia grisea TaxID=104357 RepID=A0ABR3JSQ5_9AGAR
MVEVDGWPTSKNSDPVDFDEYLRFSMLVGSLPAPIAEVVKKGVQFVKARFFVNPARCEPSMISLSKNGGTIKVVDDRFPNKNTVFVSIGTVSECHLVEPMVMGQHKQRRLMMYLLSQEEVCAVSRFGTVAETDKFYGPFSGRFVTFTSRKEDLNEAGTASSYSQSTPFFGSPRKGSSSQPHEGSSSRYPVDQYPEVLRFNEEGTFWTTYKPHELSTQVPIYDATGDKAKNLSFFRFKPEQFLRLHKYKRYRNGEHDLPSLQDYEDPDTGAHTINFSVAAVGYTAQVWKKRPGSINVSNMDGDGRPSITFNAQFVILLSHSQTVIPRDADETIAMFEELPADPWPLESVKPT